MAFGPALITLDKSELLSILVEILIYGFSLLMFGHTIWTLLAHRSTYSVNRRIIMVACLLLLVSTTHAVIDIVRLTQGFISDANDSSLGPVGYFSNVSQWTFEARQYVFTLQTLLGDGVILYRCYVVWHSKLMMVVPLLLWCGVGVTGIGTAYVSHLIHHGGVFHSQLLIWLAAFWSFALATNLLVTGLLACRIWYVDRKARRIRGVTKSQLRPLLHIIIDAGMIYSVSLLAALISFAASANFQYPMITPIISTTFYMVIIRVGLANLSRQGTSLPLKYSSAGSTDHELRIRVTKLTENRIECGRSPSTGGQSGCADELESKGSLGEIMHTT